MQDFQRRVIEEKEELDAKREKLKSFLDGELFKSLPNEEQERMNVQSEKMSEYSDVLDARIQAF